MIYFKPQHGLGNILFQIAALWTLAKDNNDELCLLNTNEHNSNLLVWGRGNLNFLFSRFSNFNLKMNNQIKKHPLHYEPIEYIRGCEYQGYFSSEKYFKHRRAEILELFKCPDEFNEKINKYSQYFGSIGLHVRRGDYLKNAHQFAITPIEYYRQALSVLPIEMHVLVFSDDLVWCKENFVGERFVFIDEIDYISLYLMAKMWHHIITNSTFSWWGAWLSEDDRVIAPKEWFAKNVTTYTDKDIYPDNWIKI